MRHILPLLLTALLLQGLARAETRLLPSAFARIDDLNDDARGGAGDNRNDAQPRAGDTAQDREMRSIFQFAIKKNEAFLQSIKTVHLKAPVQSVLGEPAPLRLVWIKAKTLPGIGFEEFHAEGQAHAELLPVKQGEVVSWDVTEWVREAAANGHGVITLRLEVSAADKTNTNNRPDNLRIAYNPEDTGAANIHLLAE